MNMNVEMHIWTFDFNSEANIQNQRVYSNTLKDGRAKIEHRYLPFKTISSLKLYKNYANPS